MTVVFVHGVPETTAVWDELRPRLGGAETVAVSLPGGLAEIGFYDRPGTVMCNSVFAEDETGQDMARYQLETMRRYVDKHRNAD